MILSKTEPIANLNKEPPGVFDNRLSSSEFSSSEVICHGCPNANLPTKHCSLKSETVLCVGRGVGLGSESSSNGVGVGGRNT